jgi:hypothetical protein
MFTDLVDLTVATVNGRREQVGRIPQPAHDPPDGTAAQAPAPTLTRSRLT